MDKNEIIGWIGIITLIMFSLINIYQIIKQNKINNDIWSDIIKSKEIINSDVWKHKIEYIKSSLETNNLKRQIEILRKDDSIFIERVEFDNFLNMIHDRTIESTHSLLNEINDLTKENEQLKKSFDKIIQNSKIENDKLMEEFKKSYDEIKTKYDLCLWSTSLS